MKTVRQGCVHGGEGGGLLKKKTRTSFSHWIFLSENK